MQNNKEIEYKKFKRNQYIKYLLMDGTVIGALATAMIILQYIISTQGFGIYNIISVFVSGIWFLYISNILIYAGYSVYISDIHSYEENNNIPHTFILDWEAYGILQKHGVNTKHLFIKNK